MSINERVKVLRRELGLTQKEFGEKITVAQSYLTSIENGKRDVTEKILLLICAVYNVNENWLRYGEGEMFESIPKDELDKLASKYKLNPMAKRIVECFVTLEENEMNAVLKFVKDIASTTYDETAATKDIYYNHSESVNVHDKYINEELESYRLELEAEKKGITSLVYGDIDEAK